MSKKPKYKVTKRCDSIDSWRVGAPDKAFICECYNRSDARKIARALNAMEDKPKAKKLKFDWSGIDEKYKWAAMDKSGRWNAFDEEPVPIRNEWMFNRVRYISENPFMSIGGKPCPGDWRDSLQKRP